MAQQIKEMNTMSLPVSDTEKIIRLDEERKVKRKKEKTARPRIAPLPKPLFERQFTDCCDSRYLERHPEAPDSLKDILSKNRMTVDELTTDNRRMTIYDLMTEREVLIELVRERANSQGDTDLLARKRFPR
jgi:hypothetical protein